MGYKNLKVIDYDLRPEFNNISNDTTDLNQDREDLEVGNLDSSDEGSLEGFGRQNRISEESEVREPIEGSEWREDNAYSFAKGIEIVNPIGESQTEVINNSETIPEENEEVITNESAHRYQLRSKGQIDTDVSEYLVK